MYKLAILIVFLGIVVSFPAGASILSVEKTSYSLGRGDVLYVGGGGPGNYSKIQDAIDDASDGDTVFVYDDMSPYLERLVINKSLSLIGEGKETTVIDGEDIRTVLDIRNVDGCLVCGFIIKNCEGTGNDFEYAVVKIHNGKNIIVEDNIFSMGYRELKDWVACLQQYGHDTVHFLSFFCYNGCNLVKRALESIGANWKCKLPENIFYYFNGLYQQRIGKY